MDWKLILQLTGIVLGLLYIYLEYKANILLWPVGIIMPAVHGILYFKSGLYADAGMQVYYIVAGIWGFAVWLRSGNQVSKERKISFTPKRQWPVLVAIYALLHLLLYCFLRYYTDSSVPFWDAMTTAISVVAMWMLAQKYIEQWLAWLVVDSITVGLYIYKGIPITACLYLLYSVLAVAGYLKWRKQVTIVP